MFIQSTLEIYIHPTETIKKAWRPGTRLVQDTGDFMTGMDSLAAVLQYGDMFDFREELIYLYIQAGISDGIIHHDQKGGYTVDYPLR